MSRTLEQKRAVYTLGFINAHARDDPSDKTKLATHIQKTPIRILQNGLGQALAFLLADDKSEHNEPSYKLYLHIQEWLCGPDSPDHPCRVYNGQECNLMKQLIEGNRTQYLHVQEEAIRLFSWLKKFADAYLDEEPKNAPAKSG